VGGELVWIEATFTVYMVSLDPTSGHEQRGNRSALIASPAEFNEATKLPVILPITSGGDFARRLGFAVPLTGISLALLILRRVMPRKVDSVPSSIMDEVLAKVSILIER